MREGSSFQDSPAVHDFNATRHTAIFYSRQFNDNCAYSDDAWRLKCNMTARSLDWAIYARRHFQNLDFKEKSDDHIVKNTDWVDIIIDLCIYVSYNMHSDTIRLRSFLIYSCDRFLVICVSNFFHILPKYPGYRYVYIVTFQDWNKISLRYIRWD